MKDNSVWKYAGFSAVGLIMLVTGAVLARALPEAQGIMLTFPYLCIGIGSGIFGCNFGMAMRNYNLKKNPEAARRFLIEEQDERNSVINNKAKAKAYDLTILILPAVILSFTLLQADLYVILTCIGADCVVTVSYFYYVGKYSKTM